MNIKSLASALLISCAAATLIAAEKPGKPNFVVILLDDVHYNATGYTGSKVIKTPNIDKLFTEGRFCKQGYVTHGVCAPSRAGLITGRFQARFAYETLSGGTENALALKHGLSLDELTIADILKPAGYTCAAVGKWHLGENKEFLPLQRGFDYHVYPVGRHNPTAKMLETGRSKLLINEEPADWPIQQNGDARYKTDLMVDLSIDWMKSVAPKQPFFLYLCPNAMHGPIEAPKGMEDYGIHQYVGMMENVDQNLGRILKCLDDIGERDNTIVFFLNDNGGGGVLKNDPACVEINNRPFSGGKAEILDGGNHVAFGIHWPAGKIVGDDYPEVVSSLDILPTMAAAANITLPTDREFDGINMLPALSGEIEPVKERLLMWRAGRGYAIRKGDMKLVWRRNDRMLGAAKKLAGTPKNNPIDRPNPADRQNGFFFEPELYNIAEDPTESNDISAQYPEIVEMLKKHCDELDAMSPPATAAELATYVSSTEGLDPADYPKPARVDKVQAYIDQQKAKQEKGKAKKNNK